MQNSLTVKLSGVNINRIYRLCLQQNITLFNINRPDYKNIVFDINKNQLSGLKQIAKTQNYKLQILKHNGFAKTINFVAKRIGLIVGCGVFLLLNFVSSFFVWNIKIYGNNIIQAEQILSVLKNNGVYSGCVFNANLLDIEDQILNNLDQISLCSVIKKGCTIIVNVKEKSQYPQG